MFGDEDRFLNRIAKLTQLLPFYPLVDAETTRQQPVYCDDVAAAIMEVVQSSKHQGKTLDLAGPKTYTNREIFDYVFTQIVEPSNAYAVPRSVGFAMASAMSLIPNPWMTLDGVRRTTVDICKPEGTPGFEELGITPTPMEDIADRYLVRFRKTSLFVEDGAVISQEK
jgi:NADH dehydrogenase